MNLLFWNTLQKSQTAKATENIAKLKFKETKLHPRDFRQCDKLYFKVMLLNLSRNTRAKHHLDSQTRDLFIDKNRHKMWTEALLAWLLVLTCSSSASLVDFFAPAPWVVLSSVQPHWSRRVCALWKFLQSAPLSQLCPSRSPFAFAQILPFIYFPRETFSLRPRCLCARSFYWRPDCLWLFPFINNDAVPFVCAASSFIFHVLLLLLLPSSPTWWFRSFPSFVPILIYRRLQITPHFCLLQARKVWNYKVVKKVRPWERGKADCCSADIHREYYEVMQQWLHGSAVLPSHEYWFSLSILLANSLAATVSLSLCVQLSLSSSSVGTNWLSGLQPAFVRGTTRCHDALTHMCFCEDRFPPCAVAVRHLIGAAIGRSGPAVIFRRRVAGKEWCCTDCLAAFFIFF